MKENSGFQTHYDNLKVSRDAPYEVIQAAYRTLAKKYHPDLNKQDPECARIMKIINESYVVLSDPEKRRRHDSWITKEKWRVRALETQDAREMQESVSQDTPVRNIRPAPHIREPDSSSLIHFFKQKGISFAKRLLIVVVFFGGFYLYDSSNSVSSTSGEKQSAPQSSGASCSSGVYTYTNGQPWPQNATVLAHNDQQKGLSTLELDNSVNNQYLFVRLVYASNKFTHNAVREAFLPAHQKLLFTSVEPGRYAVKIKDIVTGCSQISEEMLFTEQTSGREVSYTEGSLTLYPVRNGNTRLSEITDSQF